jgi:hypothetical protein
MPPKTLPSFRGTDRPFAVGRGFCFATDMVMVEGCRIGFMYREKPESPADSGWRFTAGIESREYIRSPHNLGMYDLELLVRTEPSIVPLLEAPVGSAFRRDDAGHLVPYRE